MILFIFSSPEASGQRTRRGLAVGRSETGEAVGRVEVDTGSKGGRGRIRTLWFGSFLEVGSRSSERNKGHRYESGAIGRYERSSWPHYERSKVRY